MAAVLPHVYTVHDYMVTAGVLDTYVYNGQSSAVRLAEDIFDNDLLSCMDKAQVDVEADVKSYSSLIQTQGQIRILPRVKNRIKSFI